jgi:3-oxoacyl-[acyl-carrier-protein] synthase-1
MCTPLGLSTSASEAAFRAGFLCATETPMKGRSGQPIRASYLPLIPSNFRRNERMLDLAARALEDLVSSGEPALQERISAFVGLPAKMDAALSGQLMNSLTNLLHIRVQRQVKVSFFCQGRSAFFFALEGALEALYYGTCDVALVGCTESLCSPEILKTLDTDNRLLGPALDGIIPGEGAAFVSLKPEANLHSDADRAQGEVLCVATGRESRHFYQETPNTGAGMSDAFRRLRTHPAGNGRRADLLFTCETGELFWSQEFSLAYFRNTSIMPEPFAKKMAAESFGDLGAAAGGVMFGLGIRALARLHARTQLRSHLLLCGSSDDGDIGVCFVGGPATSRAD